MKWKIRIVCCSSKRMLDYQYACQQSDMIESHNRAAEHDVVLGIYFHFNSYHTYRHQITNMTPNENVFFKLTIKF